MRWPERGVIRVRTTETLCSPDISGLIMRGAVACGYAASSQLLAELCRDPAAAYRGVFVGFADRAAKVVAIGELPTSALQLAAFVALAYSEGAPHPLVVEIGRCLREWLQREGYDHAWAVNLRHTDRAFIRGLRHFGRASRVASVFRYDFSS